MLQDTVFKVKSHIYGNGRGWVFTPIDFIGLEKETAIRKTLQRLEEKGFIRRISWGLYDYPRTHAKLGMLPPDLNQVVKALARKNKIKVLPSSAHAANLLGLSEQVPGKIVYLTDGVSKRIKVGKVEIIFKKTTSKNLSTAGTKAGVAIQALKFIGKENVDEKTIKALKRKFTDKEKASLKKTAKAAPLWVYKILARVAGEK